MVTLVSVVVVPLANCVPKLTTGLLTTEMTPTIGQVDAECDGVFISEKRYSVAVFFRHFSLISETRLVLNSYSSKNFVHTHNTKKIVVFLKNAKPVIIKPIFFFL